MKNLAFGYFANDYLFFFSDEYSVSGWDYAACGMGNRIMQRTMGTSGPESLSLRQTFCRTDGLHWLKALY